MTKHVLKAGVLTLIIIGLGAFIPNSSHAQYEKDTESIDAIITAVYESISGPAGETRQWDRFRHMFAPEAKLIPMQVRPDSARARYMGIEDYIKLVDEYFLKNGFFEVEIARTTEQFGHIAHAFSTYESRKNADDEKPFARGINSIQLMFDGNRWWVINIYWDGETPNQPIPDKYLPKDK